MTCNKCQPESLSSTSWSLMCRDDAVNINVIMRFASYFARLSVIDTLALRLFVALRIWIVALPRHILQGFIKKYITNFAIHRIQSIVQWICQGPHWILGSPENPDCIILVAQFEIKHKGENYMYMKYIIYFENYMSSTPENLLITIIPGNNIQYSFEIEDVMVFESYIVISEN